jgi:hypothetical protein
MTRALAALALCLALAGPLRAQSNCTETGPTCTTASGTLMINITIGRALFLTVTPSMTALTSPTTAHYDAGFAETTGPTTAIRSNAPWVLAVSAASAVWSATNTQTQPARTNKPAEDLLWATSPGGPFVPLTISPASVASGNASTGTTAASLFYRTLYSWALDTPGEYSLQVVFTISSP